MKKTAKAIAISRTRDHKQTQAKAIAGAALLGVMTLVLLLIAF